MSALSALVGSLTAITATGAALVDHGVHRRSSQLFGRSVHQGPGHRKSIALTFDDGPNPNTLPLLDYLAGEGISATFFQCGVNVLRHPEIAREVHRAGHELGNHTFSHAKLCPSLSFKPQLQSPRRIYQELARTQEILTEVAGKPPTLFRAPYGKRWIGLDAAQRRLQLLGVMWTVIGHDWEWPAPQIADYVLRRASPGGIVCLHDGRDIQQDVDVSEMMAALKRIVPSLRQRGYTFETVSQLLVPDPA